METLIPGALLAAIVRDSATVSEGILFGYNAETVGVEIEDSNEGFETVQRHTIFNAYRRTGRRFSFYGVDGKVHIHTLSDISQSRTVVGWFVSSQFGEATIPSIRHARVHQDLESACGHPLYLLSITVGSIDSPRVDLQLLKQASTLNFTAISFAVSSIQHDSSREFKSTAMFYPDHLLVPPRHIFELEHSVDRVLVELESVLDDLENQEAEGAAVEIENAAMSRLLSSNQLNLKN